MTNFILNSSRWWIWGNLGKWVWAGSRSWWWIGRSGVLQSLGSQRVGHDWATELNWTELNLGKSLIWQDSVCQPLQSIKLGFSKCKTGVCLPCHLLLLHLPQFHPRMYIFYFYLNCCHCRQSDYPLSSRLVQQPPSCCPVTTHALSNPPSSLGPALPFPNIHMIITGSCCC